MNPEFIGQYKNSLKPADEAVVFYDPEALKIKNGKPLSELEIKTAFGDQNITVFSEPIEFQEFLLKQNWGKSVLLMMSSGNYGGLNWETLKNSVLNF